ncbi:MAG: exo-alpha-sialidase [Saprospiraceae bacterium]|nr:exo-alpha-sialidase [Saprospiraceae bacterium]
MHIFHNPEVYHYRLKKDSMIFLAKSNLLFYLLIFSCNIQAQVSWQKRHSPNENVQTLHVGPDNNVYAGINSYGIFKSEDEGNTWNNISFGLPDSLIRFVQVASDNKVFVGTGSHGLYQNSNGNWSAINNGLPSGSVLVTSLAGTANGNMYMMSTTGEVYFWNGNIWTNITNNLPSLGRALSVGANGVLYAAVFNSGVYMYNGSNQWVRLGNQMLNDFVIKLAVGTNDTIYALCNSNNVFRCHISGGDWTPISVGLPAVNMNFIAIDSQNRLFVSVSTGKGTIYRSKNNGNTWESCTSDIYTTPFSSIAISSNSKIYTGASGIFKSVNGGNNWQDKSNNLDAPRSIYCLKSLRNGALFVGTKVGPWRSDDNGITWQLRNTGIAHLNILQITENMIGDIVLHGYNSIPKGAIYRSINQGETWTMVAANGCDLYTKIKQHRADTLWATSRFSGATTLSYSVNHGATWINNPLTISAIWDIDVTKDNTIFVVSENEGVSRSDTGGLSFTTGVGNSADWYGNALEIERDENGGIFAGSDWWTHVLWYSLPEQNGNVWVQFTDPDLVVRGIQDMIFDHFNNVFLACEDGGVRMAYNTEWSPSTNWIQSSSGLPSPTTNMLELSFDTTGYMYGIAYTNNGKNGGLFKSTVAINLPKSSVYTFIGNGSWDVASNWEFNQKPPTVLSGSKMVVINPAGNGECVLDVPFELTNGAVLKIRPGKKFRLSD